MHNQISLDGKLDGFEVDMGIYYGVAARFKPDATLVGSGTVLKAVDEIPPEEASDFKRPQISPDDPNSYVVFVDSKGVIRCHHVFRRFEMIKDVIVLVSKATPEEYIEYLDEREYDHIEAGEDKVDLEKALELLNERYGFETIRTDAGAILNSIMLDQGLIDEISLIITPELVGKDHTSMFGPLSSGIKLHLKSSDLLENGLVHVIYRVVK
jgi:2,5-diamino-6-(ribosylamino)-4(3H)-pyrimidinone 5'-phosphate reductase